MTSKKVVVVTGASSGIGADLVKEYIGRGFRVVAAARRRDRLETLSKSLGSDNCLPVVCDVCDDISIENLLSETRKQFGRIDIVVANAGVGVHGTLEKLHLDDFRRQIETNVYGVVTLLKGAIQDLKKTQGRMVIVGSAMSYISLPGSAPYCASKFAIRGFADAIRLELLEHGISVTVVCPGFISTEFRQVDKKGVFQKDRKDVIPEFLMLSAKATARKIIRAAEKRKAEISVTAHAAIGIWFARHFPNISRFILGILAGRTLKIKEASGMMKD